MRVNQGKVLLKLYSCKELKIMTRLIKQKNHVNMYITYIYNKIMVEISHIVVSDMCLHKYIFMFTGMHTIYFTSCSN